MSEFVMALRNRSKASPSTHACRIACLIVLGALLAGCDKCGDWFNPLRYQADYQTDSCRDQAPRPQ